MPDAPTPLDLDGVGWYEVIHPTAATTLLAYVHEDGSVYFPETNDGQVEFALAAARGHVHRLVRADGAEAEVERLRAEVRLAQAVAQGFKDALADAYRPHIEQNRAYAVAIKAYEAEAGRLRAEVARLTARPAPAWDEEVVVEGVARRLHADACSEQEYAWEPNAGTFRDQARELLAVVRDHLPVKPDREVVARAILDALDGCIDYETQYLLADAVLDLWPGESRATVQAEALHDAADEYEARLPDGTGNGRAYNSYTVAAMLRARADRLAAEGGADRG